MSRVQFIAASSCLKKLVFMAAVLLTLMAPSAVVGEPLRLTVDGQISGLSDPIPGQPDGNAALGLLNGDPFRFVFDFDSQIGENGLIAIERYEVLINGQSLVPAEPLVGTDLSIGFNAIDSRFSILASDVPIGEVNGIEVGFTVITAAPFILEVTFPDSVLAGSPGAFPANLEFSDVTSFHSAIFILTDSHLGKDGEGIGAGFTVEFTDLSVAVVPEPGTAALSVLAFGACLQRRRAVDIAPRLHRRG